MRRARSCGCGPSSRAGSGTTSATTPARSSTSWPGRPRVAVPTTRRSRTTGSTRGRPCSGPARPRRRTGTPRLFLDRFPTDDGRAHLVAVDHHGPADDVSAAMPVHLVTGRLLHHYQSGAQTRRVAQLVEAAPGPLLEIHPVLADTHGVTDGRCRARHLRPRRARRDGVGDRCDPAGHRLPAVPLGRGAQREPAHQRRDRPGVRDARVQGLRGPARPGRPPTSTREAVA